MKKILAAIFSLLTMITVVSYPVSARHCDVLPALCQGNNPTHNHPNNPGNRPTDPPVTNPPVTRPPVTQPPGTNPPSTRPPSTNPPGSAPQPGTTAPSNNPPQNGTLPTPPNGTLPATK